MIGSRRAGMSSILEIQNPHWRGSLHNVCKILPCGQVASSVQNQHQSCSQLTSFHPMCVLLLSRPPSAEKPAKMKEANGRTDRVPLTVFFAASMRHVGNSWTFFFHFIQNIYIFSC